MNAMEVLTLLLVVFETLSYIDNHKKKHKRKKKRKKKNKKKQHPLPPKVQDAISFLAN